MRLLFRLARLLRIGSCGSVLALALAACKSKPEPEPARVVEPMPPNFPTDLRTIQVKEKVIGYELDSYPALPDLFRRAKVAPSPAQVELGRKLFFDPRFSKNHDISCNSCHVLEQYGTDRRAFSVGHRGQVGRRNAPSVFNAAGNLVLFWDGRAKDVERQAKVPVLDATEMAMNDEARVLDTIRSIPDYIKAFEQAFPGEAEPVTYDNFGLAIGAFERGLITPSRWDRFRKGDKEALTEQEKLGFLTFFQAGCAECHSGALVGSGTLELLGRMRPWPNQTDIGHGQITGNPLHRMIFKVASLRNVTETGPYFHDASSTTLEDAVKRMAIHQVGVDLSAAQIEAITSWLKTLTGAIDAEYIEAPKLPKSSASTPKPDPS